MLPEPDCWLSPEPELPPSDPLEPHEEPPDPDWPQPEPDCWLSPEPEDPVLQLLPEPDCWLSPEPELSQPDPLEPHDEPLDPDWPQLEPDCWLSPEPELPQPDPLEPHEEPLDPD